MNILVFVALAISTVYAQSNLTVGPISFAGYNNYLYRDNTTACQFVVTNNASTSPSRFIAAFPNGNTGAMVYFLPRTTNTTLGVTLDYSSVKSVNSTNNQTGVSGSLSISNDVQFGVTLSAFSSSLLIDSWRSEDFEGLYRVRGKSV